MAEPMTLDFTLAIDPITQTIEIVGIETNMPNCEPVLMETEFPYVKKFRVESDVGRRIYDWFIACGMTRKDAEESVAEIKKSLKGLFASKPA